MALPYGPPCDEGDVVSIAYAPGPELADARPGATLAARIEVGDECIGAPLSLVAFRREEGSLVTHDAAWARANERGEVALAIEAPPCAFRAQVWLGRVGDGVVLDSAEVAGAACPVAHPPACPGDVRAATQAGFVNLTWTPVEGADGYAIRRAAAGGEMLLLATLDANATAYSDAGVVVGETYAYAIVAQREGIEARGCPAVTLVAVPYFPGMPGIAIACVAGAAALALLRRR